MKLKFWSVLLGKEADSCKHTQWVCDHCGTIVHQDAVWTKTRKIQRDRAMRRLQKALKDSDMSVQEEE